MGAPCDWDVSDALTCCPTWATYDPAVQAAAISFATDVLWALSGRQFGVCPKTIRPCASWVGQTYRTYGVWLDGYANGAVSPVWWPYIDQGGVWRNGCGCNGVCCCEPSQQVWIPGPSPSITSVTVNNVLVPPANYRLGFANGLFWLVGQNGQKWPECQNFDVPASSTDNTFVVVLGDGIPVPETGLLMAGLMACEYAKMCTGLPCALSAAATAITRDGVSYEILTPSDLISKGFTPMPIVNQWIYSVNPRLLPERPRVWSIDDDAPRVTV